MIWQPNLIQYQLKKGSNKLLWEAFEKSQPNHLEYRLKDNDGVFALDTEKGILTAKRYIYGNIVSCHKRAVFSAINQDKKLIMYIGDVGAFYTFNPAEIWNRKNHEENKRGDNIMMNFNIKLGTRMEVLS